YADAPGPRPPSCPWTQPSTQSAPRRLPPAPPRARGVRPRRTRPRQPLPRGPVGEELGQVRRQLGVARLPRRRVWRRARARLLEVRRHHLVQQPLAVERRRRVSVHDRLPRVRAATRAAVSGRAAAARPPPTRCAPAPRPPPRWAARAGGAARRRGAGPPAARPAPPPAAAAPRAAPPPRSATSARRPAAPPAAPTTPRRRRAATARGARRACRRRGSDGGGELAGEDLPQPGGALGLGGAAEVVAP